MKKIVMSLLVIAVAIGLVGAGASGAWFSDTETSTGNTFTAGTLSIDNSGLTSAVAITIPNMAPGDVTGEYVVTMETETQ